MIKYNRRKILCYAAVFAGLLAGCVSPEKEKDENFSVVQSVSSLEKVPEFSGTPYVELNDNQPAFEENELTTETFEEYSNLDNLGRCGAAEACVGEETMPVQERESISEVKPTGWKNQKYENIDGEYLYNRCHLIGFQLTGENANEENLITGTRYMNTQGMLPFENMVAEYIHETGNHVMYRVTPVFEGDDLVASGVQMEAESVEDEGTGICFNVYVYNVQPSITINYSTGENWESITEEGANELKEYDRTGQLEIPEGNWAEQEQTYIINQNTKKIHKPGCSSVGSIAEKNKKQVIQRKSVLIENGYEPCGNCKP